MGRRTSAAVRLSLASVWVLALCLVVLAPAPVAVQAAAPVLLRDPYLTDVGPTWAMVNLATNSASPAPVVSWGPAGAGCTAPASSATAAFVASFGSGDQQFKAKLTGLQPGSRYCYRVSQSGLDLLGTAPVFTTALAAGATSAFTFAVFGDWGAGTADESKVLARVAAAHPSFIVTSGDNVYNDGTQADYGDLNGGNVFPAAYWPQLGRTIPAFLAAGNH